MSLEDMPNEILLRILSAIIDSEVVFGRKIGVIHSLNIVCRTFYDVVLMHPVMVAIRACKISSCCQDAAKMALIYSHGLLLNDIKIKAKNYICNKISKHNKQQGACLLFTPAFYVINEFGNIIWGWQLQAWLLIKPIQNYFIFYLNSLLYLGIWD